MTQQKNLLFYVHQLKLNVMEFSITLIVCSLYRSREVTGGGRLEENIVQQCVVLPVNILLYKKEEFWNSQGFCVLFPRQRCIFAESKVHVFFFCVSFVDNALKQRNGGFLL